jgi:hypothetical protein
VLLRTLLPLCFHQLLGVVPGTTLHV